MLLIPVLEPHRLSNIIIRHSVRVSKYSFDFIDLSYLLKVGQMAHFITAVWPSPRSYWISKTLCCMTKSWRSTKTFICCRDTPLFINLSPVGTSP